MKSNMQETNDGYLLPEMYEEYAEWMSAYITGYKRYHGIDVGWVSLQNEPEYTATWETCIYTPEQLRDLIKVVGKKFEKEGITAKILIPETSGVQNAIRYIETIMFDPEVARYADAFAVHLYDIPFLNPDQGVAWLRGLSSYRTRYNKSLWMTSITT
jgi:O-glycosyl hydrolase